MNAEQFDRERLYQATMHVARTLFRNELITDVEFTLIDTKMREKYRPILGSLCAVNSSK